MIVNNKQGGIVVKYRKIGAVAAGTAVLVLGVAGCGSSTPASSAAASHKGPLTIALSNSYIGNGWRVEMEHVVEAYSHESPYNHLVKLKVDNSSNSVSAQLSSMDNMISAHVSAIIVDAASPTGLNQVVAQAHQQHIPVVSFDNTVTSPYAYNVDIHQFQFGVIGATWLVKTLHGQGNIIMNRGVSGTPVDIRRYEGAMSVFNKYPGIHVIDQIYGQWDDAVTQSQFATALASYPKISAVWSEGGTYGAIQAFLSAGRKLVPMAGEASNGFRLALINPKYQADGLTGISIGDPPALSAVALKYATAILQGKKEPHHIWIQPPVLTAKDIKAGVNAYPNLPMTVYDDFTGVAGLTFTPHQMETGK